MECITETEHCPDWLESCLSGDGKATTEDFTGQIRQFNNANQSPEERKGTYVRLKQASRPHSTPQTLKWLEENYELAEGVCIPRSTLYVHYLDFCEKQDTQPVNAASFGKIIRQQFPQLTTRRLGTRGQSKYHYYGIGVRESSVYYEIIYSANGVQNHLDTKKGDHKQNFVYSPRSKLGTLLPEFPDIKDIQLPAEVAEDKVLTFLMMYRAHCQRILDTVIRANFDEVQSFLIHFWQGMPNHIKTTLECKVLVAMIGVCDSILYKAVAGVLMPSVLQPLPDSLTQVIRQFSGQFEEWLHQAMDSLPQTLQKVKCDLARRFSQVLRRQTSLNHLCQAARTVVHSPEITSQMLDDWSNVDLSSIIKQTLYTMDNYSDHVHNVMVKLTGEFEVLLEDQAPLESYIEWLDAMMDQCVIQRGNQQIGTMRTTARQFLLMWSCFGTRVIRDMTLHSAPSFGSFHLLHLMFDEYVLYMVENLHCQERGNELLRAVRGEQNLDFLDEMTVPDSASTCVDRSSVIRSPSTSQQPLEYSPPSDCVHLHEDNNNTLLQNSYRETASNSTKYHSTFRNSLYSGAPLCYNQYSDHYQSQGQGRATNRNDEISSFTATRDPSSLQVFPGNVKQVETAGSTISNWYDWTSRSVNCMGIPGQMTSSRCSDFPCHVTSSRSVNCAAHPGRVQSADTFTRQTTSASCQNNPNDSVANCNRNFGIVNYVPYTNDSSKRCQIYGEAILTKRKVQHNVACNQNKHMENFYPCNTGASLV